MGFTNALKKLTALALACVMLPAALSACGMKPQNPDPTEVPHTTPLPEAPCTKTHYIRYWPEDADYETCDYACTIEKPEFSMEHYAGGYLNAAVEGYIEDLEERIERQYMPAAIAHPPYTQVSCEVEYVNGVTNIVFTEKHCFEAQPFTETHAYMFDDRGGEINMRDIFLSYRAEERVAELIARSIKDRPGYYQADANTVLAAIDVQHGAKATEDGCVVYVKAGLLAPYEEGELAFVVKFADVCPDFVGRVMSADEYRMAAELMSYAAAAAAIRGENIENGEISPFTATKFMGLVAPTLGIAPSAGRINVPAERFESVFRGCFGVDFPGVDKDAPDIEVKDGFYCVLASRAGYECNVDMAEAAVEDGLIVIRGDVMDGRYGSPVSSYICHAVVRLERAPGSPFGFILRGYTASV